jgi:hypothetical protein
MILGIPEKPILGKPDAGPQNVVEAKRRDLVFVDSDDLSEELAEQCEDGIENLHELIDAL